jgi:hypothetical protein
MGEYATREAMMEQAASLSEIESLMQVEATEARKQIKTSKRKQTPLPGCSIAVTGFFLSCR